MIIFLVMQKYWRRLNEEGKVFKVFTMMTAGVLLLTGCGGQTAGETENRQSETGTEGGQNKDGGTELNVFIAASLSGVMEEVAAAYNADHPNVKLILMQTVQAH